MEIEDRIVELEPHYWGKGFEGACVVNFVSDAWVQVRKLNGEYRLIGFAAIRRYTTPADWVQRVAEDPTLLAVVPV